ncbi:MAG: hypothetical protein IE933_13040 [Sphingomonadales bacterium]|nr:hypothetical protein [Sphingomonadales bacterium]MBD3773950.1 hypothetical protein [Paracoccaceae bacterium]
MSEANFASLGPSLLARKGGAKPAMRPQLGALSPMAISEENFDDLGWNDMGDEDAHDHQPAQIVPLTPSPANAETAAEAQEQDLAAAAELAEVAAEKPAVVRQREAMAEHFTPAIAAVPAKSRPERTSEPKAERTPERTPERTRAPKAPARSRGKRAAFTLRLDESRHLKLRLACTIRNRSAQQIVTEALDTLLADIDELESLAAQVKRR